MAENGYDPIYGARPLKRFIQREIENKLANEILEGNIKVNKKYLMDVEGINVVLK